MTKWLGNHLVRSNNNKERIAQLRNKRTNTHRFHHCDLFLTKGEKVLLSGRY